MRYTVPGIYLCLLLSLSQIAQAQCPSAIPLTISGVTTTESRCQASGTATVNITGGTAPFAYSITAGPVLYTTPQSANIFQSLQAGTYTAQVRDLCNTISMITFTIAGTYSTPQPAQGLTPPTCPGGNDGSLLVGVTGGRAPFTYSLISPSPVIVAPQPNGLFNNLPAGVYTYQITDSCGNFQTRTTTLPDGDNGAFWVNASVLQYQACDSFSLSYQVYPMNMGQLRPPYTMTLVLPNGVTKTHTFTTVTPTITGDIIKDTFYFSYHHTSGVSDPLRINGTNGCSYAAVGFSNMQLLDMYPNRSNQGNCSRDLTYTLEIGADNSSSATAKYHCNNITYTLVSPTGVVLATQTNNSSFTGYPPANGYRMVREDCCMKDSVYFNWEQRPSLKITYLEADPGYACKEGTTSVWMLTNNITEGSIIVAAGPPSVTLSDGTVHNYIYPDTLTHMPFGSTSVRINYLGAGTYTFIAVDTCGEKDTATFTVTPAHLRRSSFSTNLVKGCVNDNKILLNAESNGGQWDASVWVNNQPWYPVAYPWKDSAINVAPGTYSAVYAYHNKVAPWAYLKGMDALHCDTIRTTVIVPVYTQPAFTMAPAIAVCGNNRLVALLPDSISGVSPYRYQITSAPAATPLQSSNVFTGLFAGTYNFLMADACGNSVNNSIAIDTLRVPAVTVTGTACQGTSTTLSLPTNPYYTYSWLYPNGQVITGHSITIDPVTQNDTGRYVVTVNSNINGCTDSEEQAINVQFCSVDVLPMRLLHFAGNRQGSTVVLQWKTSQEINTSHFVVERSTDGIHFISIQKVKTSGNETGAYTATDLQPVTGKLFYRLQMVDKDGSATYSNILTINYTNNLLTVIPKLITHNNNIKVSYTASSKTATIQLIGIDGKIWRTQAVAKGSVQTQIPTSTLPAGHYFVLYTGEEIRTAVPVVKL